MSDCNIYLSYLSLQSMLFFKGSFSTTGANHMRCFPCFSASLLHRTEHHIVINFFPHHFHNTILIFPSLLDA